MPLWMVELREIVQCIIYMYMYLHVGTLKFIIWLFSHLPADNYFCVHLFIDFLSPSRVENYLG